MKQTPSIGREYFDQVTEQCGQTMTIARTWTATDECDNVASAVQTIVVQDLTPPVLSIPVDVTLDCPADTHPEATGIATMCRFDDDPETIATTSGRAIPNVEVKLVDTEGHPVAPGEPGHVLVKGYNIMKGYLDEPEATANPALSPRPLTLARLRRGS